VPPEGSQLSGAIGPDSTMQFNVPLEEDPLGVGGTQTLPHPFLRQEDILLYSTGASDSADADSHHWQIIPDAKAPGVNRLKIAVHGVYGTDRKVAHRVQQLDTSTSELVDSVHFGQHVPPGVYDARFLGFNIEELTGSSHKKDQPFGSSTYILPADLKFGADDKHCIVVIKIFINIADLVAPPATYVQEDVTEDAPGMDDPLAPDLPLGGQIQAAFYEEGNVDGLGPYPIYLEGESLMQNLELSTLFMQNILVAGVRPEFKFMVLRNFPSDP